jgi:glycerol-3-phosphate acyltransferase PlsX
MVAALWHLKRLPGVLRPAIASPIPTAKGVAVLLDAGANTECKPWLLLQFATMGALYAKHIFKIAKPSVGILSNGEEESKGNELVREAVPLLKYSGLNFRGPIEGRDIPAGTVDVIVCDGFVGNVVLKLYEGVASTLLAGLKAEIEKSPVSRLGGLLIRGAGRALKKRMSYDEYGGAPLLGVGGIAIIAHGKSNAKAIFNAHRVASELVKTGATDQIRASLEEMKANLELARVR